MTASSTKTRKAHADVEVEPQAASALAMPEQPGKEALPESKNHSKTTPVAEVHNPTKEMLNIQEEDRNTLVYEAIGTNNDKYDKDAVGLYREQLQQRLDEELNNLETTQEQARERLRTTTEDGDLEADDVDVLNLTVDASQARADILAVVRSLERQTDTSAKFKDILEGEIEVLQKNLAKEKALRVDLEESLNNLKSSWGSLPQLREENTELKAKCERQKQLLEEIRPQLASVTEGRDMLTEEAAFAKKQVRELAGKNAELETQVKHLREKLSSVEHLREEASTLTNQRQVLTEQVRKLMNRLEEANKTRDTLELDLTAAHESLCQLQRERQALQDAVTDDGTEVSRLRTQLLAQSTELATVTEKLQLETAARRQTEEMLREVKSRLLSLSHNKSVASVLGAAGE